jgi:hypothetical protein
MKFNLLFCGWLALAIPAAIPAEPSLAENFDALKNAVILVIRHAEKPDKGYGLSAAGEARANAYVKYFKNFKIDGQPLKLDCLFAAADSKESHRSRLTLEPTGKALGLAIDARFKNNNFQKLADEIRSNPHVKAILIVWHHGQIPSLLRALGADPRQAIPNGQWPDDVFGWLIQLRYDSDGHLIEAKRINEHLLPDDSNNHTSAVLDPPGPS